MTDQITVAEIDLLRILAYLTSSADTQLFEPDIYGPFRMVEAASQLANAILEGDPGAHRAFWEQIQTNIDENKFRAIWDKQSFRDFVSETPRGIGEELARRDHTERKP
tara:strand:- start:1266 stop:1589 length:324 start_codon:yes stop_codon:yes gene_type:complete